MSAREHGEVSEYERQYQDGGDPQVLDIIDIPLKDPRPSGYQRENWLLDPRHYWVRAGRLAWGDLAHLVDAHGSLWIDGHNTSAGRNDYFPLALAEDLTSSLRLVRVDGLVLRVFAPGEAFGDNKRKVQATFTHARVRYSLWVTDPRYEHHFLAQADGEYQLGAAFVTISLGEPFNGNVYKLVAAIIEAPGGVIR